MPIRNFYVKLPPPPSFNDMYTWYSGKMQLSPRYKEWKRLARTPIRNAIATLAHNNDVGRNEFRKGRLKILIEAFVYVRRDLDNVEKPVQDALEFYGLLENDNKFVDIHLKRMNWDKLPPGIPETIHVYVSLAKRPSMPYKTGPPYDDGSPF